MPNLSFLSQKYFFPFLVLLFLGFQCIAQPQKVNYQAVALTAGGQPVKNQAIKLRLSIVDSSATGTVLYSETHQTTTDGAGQFSVILGGGTATLGTFSNIAWSNGRDKFLKAEADVTGGTNYVLMGTSQMVSVPYALNAGSLKDSSKVIAQDGTQWSLIVGANGPTWQQSSGPGGVNMNYPCPGVPTVTYGGQTYNTVQIGTQCWFKENLNVGTMVQYQSNNSAIEKYCYNNDSSNCLIYGGLYEWGEGIQYFGGANNYTSLSANSGKIQGVCPSGWHIPSNQEFCLLTQFLDSSVNCINGWNGTVVSLKMKLINTLWTVETSSNVNSSGFSILPSGFRFWSPRFITFYYVGTESHFWTSTDNAPNLASN